MSKEFFSTTTFLLWRGRTTAANWRMRAQPTKTKGTLSSQPTTSITLITGGCSRIRSTRCLLNRKKGKVKSTFKSCPTSILSRIKMRTSLMKIRNNIKTKTRIRCTWKTNSRTLRDNKKSKMTKMMRSSWLRSSCLSSCRMRTICPLSNKCSSKTSSKRRWRKEWWATGRSPTRTSTKSSWTTFKKLRIDSPTWETQTLGVTPMKTPIEES